MQHHQSHPKHNELKCTIYLKRFLKNFRVEGLRWGIGPRMKKISKTLILVFEVIVQPPKHTIEIGFFFRVLAHCEAECVLCFLKVAYLGTYSNILLQVGFYMGNEGVETRVISF